MRRYLGRCVAVNIVPSCESIESAAAVFGEDETVGFESDDFRTLFVGEPGETAAEAGARAEVAREVFAELMEEGAADEIARLNAAYAAWLLCAGSMPWRAFRGTDDVTRMGAAA